MQKPTITVDAREAGSGKTRDKIYPLIQANQAARKRTLIVVPSIHLQQEYKAGLRAAGVRDVVIVNSEESTTSSVVDSVIDALESFNTICITHAAFLLLDHKKSKHLLNDFELILDEAFEPIKQIELTNKRNLDNTSGPSADFKWNELFDFGDNFEAAQSDNKLKHFPVVVRAYANESNMFSATAKELQSTNWKYFISPASVDSLVNETAERVSVIADFDLEVLTYFKSVHIAAAHFERENLAAYMRANNFAYSVIKGCEYNGHSSSRARIAFHYPTTKRINPRLSIEAVEPLNLTGNLKKTNADVMSKFRDVYMGAIDATTPHIVLKNNADSFLHRSKTAHLIKHNSHGLNVHKDKTAIVITSAIRPDPYFAAHLRDMLGYKTTDEVFTKWAATKFYQAIMRLALRDKNFDGEITVVIADGVAAKEVITHYFDGLEVQEHTYELLVVNEEEGKSQSKQAQYRRDKRAGLRPERAPAKSNAERQRARRERLKQQQAGVTIH